ncbi:DUF397 domain-containing protein [Streptomyces sp. 2MCAF27]
MLQPDWQRSSFCSEGNACVHVAAAGYDTVLLRESDDPDVILVTTRRTLRAFISSVKTGTLDNMR